jgi:Uma2 family endonuclease
MELKMAVLTVHDPLTTALPTHYDDSLYEVVDGERVEIPPMSIFSNMIAARLYAPMNSFASQRRLGVTSMEALFILDPIHDLRRRPDVAFVTATRWPLDREFPVTGDWEVVPNLAVEVISPTELFNDVLSKAHEYFRYGVEQVWLVVPAVRQVYIYDSPTRVRILGDNDTIDGITLLPGFQLPVAQLFQRAPLNGKSA